MKLPQEGQLLRIFIGETDKHEGKPLYEAIVKKARELGMAGATVYRGVLGYGANSLVHTSKILRISENLPMVVEIVDAPENIQKILPELDSMVKEGLVTLERAEIILYRHNNRRG